MDWDCWPPPRAPAAPPLSPGRALDRKTCRTGRRRPCAHLAQTGGNDVHGDGEARKLRSRHPEVRAKRASKGDDIQVGYSRLGHLKTLRNRVNPISIGASAVSFEARAERGRLRMTGQRSRGP